jgi:hypothetical protein
VLYIVLALVVAAFGLLIAALTTANTLWAWLSVIVSVVAAALLVTDWWRGRRARAARQATPTVVTVGGDRRAEEHADPVVPPAEPAAPAARAVPPEPATAPAEVEVTGHLDPVPADDGEPDEEPTDASDLLVVAGLSAEVRVVDEHPRYHLATCTWLGPRPTIPIAVSEARQLGFTPCARCGPDAILAARHRAGR